MTTPTTSTRRRTRRSLAALAATVLCASVLAIVAGSPAGAANTASEGLYDHDEDANTASVRRYAGATRYSTALAVAKRFVDQANQTGLVETAIIASGTNLVDAAAAAGLAASKDAPILLTSPNRLQKAVAKFIDDEFISDIFVIGGEAAVSAAVVEDLEEIASVRSVKRLSGADRYATAAALADEVGAAGEFCNTTQIGAVLVNVDASFADVIVAGPLAYALELPILLTTVDTLPPDAAGFLTDEEIEHVVIVGGTAVVSAAVEEAVLDTGVSDTTRIAGANRYATSIEVLKAISGCNNGTVSLDSGGVALVNDASASDGIVASTILGQGLRAAGVTPALLVSDVLPTEISAYLAATPTQLDSGAYVDLSITAIGSTTSVSAAVVTAARTAATTSEPLTATISAKAGESSVSFKFSGAVDNTLCGGTTATGTSVCNRAHYRVAGGSLLAGDSVDITGVTATLAIVGDTLAAGDTITLAGGKVKGLGDDNRRVAAASFTVPKPTPDNQRPRIRIVAPVGADEFAIRITEATPALGEGIVKEEITINGAALPASATIRKDDPASQTDFVVCLNGQTGTAGTVCTGTAVVLVAGQRISVAKDAFFDASKNANRTSTVTVQAAATKAPRVEIATVTAATTVKTGSGAATTYSVATSASDGNIVITAKPDGAAGGALGNSWYVSWERLDGGVDDKDSIGRVTVDVFTARKTIRIATDEDATIITVLNALGANDEFNENFGAASKDEVPGGTKFFPDGTASPAVGRVPLSGGVSQVVITLTYSEVLKTFDAETVVTDNEDEPNYPYTSDDDSTWTPVASYEPLDSQIKLTLTSGSLAELPTAGSTINLAAGVATGYGAGVTRSLLDEDRRLRSA